MNTTVTFDPAIYQLVPIEPSDDMQQDGAESIRFDTTAINKIWTGNKVYRSMLAAAPDALPGVVTHSGSPALGVLLDDCDEGNHKKYGEGYFFTADCIVGLYTHPAPDAHTIVRATLEAAINAAESWSDIPAACLSNILAISPESILSGIKS